MRTADTQQAAEFFARLANVTDRYAFSSGNIWINKMNASLEAGEKERAALLPDFKQMLAGMMSLPADQLRNGDDFQDIQLSSVLFQLQRPVREKIFSLLGGSVITLGDYILTGWLEGGALIETLEPHIDEEHGSIGWSEQAEAKFHQLLRLRPFPFGLCQVCHKVFVQPDRGKPRRYCSDACKQKGIPSAVKRTEYARAWRHRTRAREVGTTQRILLAWPEVKQYWPRLQKEFPRKSRRKLLYLVKQAQRHK